MPYQGVQVPNPEQMNLLGLLMRGFLEQQLLQPRLLKRAQSIRGAFGIQAGEMAITLAFSPDAITLRPGFCPPLRARVKGSVHELVRLVLSGGYLTATIAMLEGRISVRGNPFALLPLMPLLFGNSRPTLALPEGSSKENPR